MIEIPLTLREEVVAAARRAYQIGLQTGNGGNLSARVPGTEYVLIKPSGSSFGESSVEDFIVVDLAGNQVHGQGKPSRELHTHLAIYTTRPEVGAVFHTHSPWSIAYASFADEFPPVTYHASSKLGRIPILHLASEDPALMVETVRTLLRADYALQVFVQSQHGIFSFAHSITLAEHNAELVEETAQIAWLVALGNHLRLDSANGNRLTPQSQAVTVENS